jgi:hypothetical protein
VLRSGRRKTLWQQAWFSGFTTTNTEHTKSLGTGADYFYNTTWIRFGFYAYLAKIVGETANISEQTDYAAVQITYGVPVVALKAGLNIPEALAIILGNIC